MSSPSKISRVKKANARLKGALRECSICPRRCGTDRAAGKRGYCAAPALPVVYSYSPHHGEEPPLSGRRGSGTIFFSHCNMKCVYCQNYYFSQLDNGAEVTIEKLSGMMLYLQKAGCHNINLVSPTHFVPQIMAALEIALEKGLNIPIVYNTGGYDLVETIRLLEGIVDIYLPDMRYSDNETAEKYSDAPDYVEHNKASVKEMNSQVGDLILDDDGVARRGLIVRLLVLPNDISGIKKTLKFIKEEIGGNTYLSVMGQYYPTFKAYSYKDISRAVSRDEYKNIVDEVKFLELNNGWIQEGLSGADTKFFGTKIKPKV